MSKLITRRRMLTTSVLAAPAVLIGCDRLAVSPSFKNMVLSSGEWLSYRAQRLLGANALAREYDPSDMSPEFRTNGNTQPRSDSYRRHQNEGFVNWQLTFGGMFENPRNYSLAQLKAKPSRTQITRHDCVEGWTAIGKWKGTPLKALLDEVRLQPEAKFIVFRCADDFSGRVYYESIDLVDAFHPQTILAYEMNDGDLSVAHGAPIRLRVERQLGYKHAKYVMAITAVASMDRIGRGQGGYWEDAGNYDWYAGI